MLLHYGRCQIAYLSSGFYTGHSVRPNVNEFWDGIMPWSVFKSIVCFFLKRENLVNIENTFLKKTTQIC